MRDNVKWRLVEPSKSIPEDIVENKLRQVLPARPPQVFEQACRVGVFRCERHVRADPPRPHILGVAHIDLCPLVPDVAASVETLKGRPYFKTDDHPIDLHLGINRKRQANLFDPDGTRTELMESHTIDGKPTPSSTAPPPE